MKNVRFGSLIRSLVRGRVAGVVIFLLLQVMYGEAHSQAVMYGTGDPTQQAIGVSIRNRLGDSVYFKGSTNYNNAITPGQFMGIASSVTTGTTAQGVATAELLNAAAVYDGSSTISVANARCFFSPSAAGWTQIQAALATATTLLPTVSFDPKCFGPAFRQFIYKSSVSLNTNGSGAPSFIFVQMRKSTDPAVIQIP